MADGISPSEFTTFARCLSVFDDNEIKDIENKNRDHRARTMVILNEYEVRTQSLRKVILALNLISRKDLAERVKSVK